jgi:hypothetical protein
MNQQFFIGSGNIIDELRSVELSVNKGSFSYGILFQLSGKLLY